ncbi:unnamed protein product [Phytophthora lilii]|uniref:Unnamed protein product n=1 Tax=Phytophthora lilii TaxID=2077276 RepID=A0A9W6TNE4_9STRA|nr:unnamed protein product [Phytophthora lilii]
MIGRVGLKTTVVTDTRGVVEAASESPIWVNSVRSNTWQNSINVNFVTLGKTALPVSFKGLATIDVMKASAASILHIDHYDKRPVAAFGNARREKADL